MPDFIDADSGKIITIENVGEECRRVRLEKGLTQAQLSKMAGVSTSVISRFERGDCSFQNEVCYRITDALSIVEGPAVFNENKELVSISPWTVNEAYGHEHKKWLNKDKAFDDLLALLNFFGDLAPFGFHGCVKAVEMLLHGRWNEPLRDLGAKIEEWRKVSDYNAECQIYAQMLINELFCCPYQVIEESYPKLLELWGQGTDT